MRGIYVVTFYRAVTLCGRAYTHSITPPEEMHLRITLPGDEWVDLRSPDELTVDDLVDVQDAVTLTTESKRGESRDNGTAETKVTTALSTRMEVAMLAKGVTAWSLLGPDGKALPISPYSISTLRLPVWRVLRDAVRPHMLELQSDPNSPSGSEIASASSTG